MKASASDGLFPSFLVVKSLPLLQIPKLVALKRTRFDISGGVCSNLHPVKQSYDVGKMLSISLYLDASCQEVHKNASRTAS